MLASEWNGNGDIGWLDYGQMLSYHLVPVYLFYYPSCLITMLAPHVLPLKSSVGLVLGGGVIIRDGFSIRGLNTAATLWCAAAVGTLTGAGFLIAAILGAAGVLLANILLRPIALFMNQKSKEESPEQTNYLLSLTCSEEHEAHIRFYLCIW